MFRLPARATPRLGLYLVEFFALLSLTSCDSPPRSQQPPVANQSNGGAPLSAAKSEAPGSRPATASTWQAPITPALQALNRGRYVSFSDGPDTFPLVAQGKAAPLWVSEEDTAGVRRAVSDLREDIKKVTGITPSLLSKPTANLETIVLVGTLGHSPVIDELVKNGKLDVSAIEGRWETHLITTIPSPLPGVGKALVIVGSDARGTMYGSYDLSKQIGVSPWYFWDDVPIAHQDTLAIAAGRYSQGEPVVKYRGFFINDEEPQLGSWARATFGPAPNPQHAYAFNHKLYAHVFELMLRLKANYLWPAVWARSLFDDDPRSQSLAAEFGIVMGTSHEAPMMRAQDEWNRFGMKEGPYGGNGAFSFARNQPALEKYWADGLRRMKDYESLVTVGMRGNGDTGMEDAAGTELMGRIVASQRKTISEILGKPAKEVPQVWTLYKEVQDYWDAGMRAPDDVTIIWCDDNWGNMRGLPDAKMTSRTGGYGLYYHFDYVGGSRNYKWVDTTLLPNMWEQLHLSYRYGVDRVWMANVGDLKNDEHPLEFFLDYAWDPMRWPVERLHEWEVQWATTQFGDAHARKIANVVERYGRLQSRRKPELLNRKITLDPQYDLKKKDEASKAILTQDGSPYSLVHYREAERVVQQWSDLLKASKNIRSQLPSQYDDAYYQLVHYAVAASANVYALHLAQFNNRLYAEQGRAATATLAAKVETLFAKDQAMSRYYNTQLAGGKWQGWQSQPKLGYGGNYPNSSWQQPQENGRAMRDFVWPPVKTISLPETALLAVALDGSENLWTAKTKGKPGSLPEFTPFQSQPQQYLEIVNRGQKPFEYHIESSVPWLRMTPQKGKVGEQVRVSLKVDWLKAPAGQQDVVLTVHGAGSHIRVIAPVDNIQLGKQKVHAFIEANGYLSLEAAHYHQSIHRGGIGFKLIPDMGRTEAGLTPFPVDAERQVPGGKGVRLEYRLHTFSEGPVAVWAYLSPRNNVRPADGLRYAISIDDDPPQEVDIIGSLNAVPPNRSWERNISDNVIRIATRHTLKAPGAHTLKFWMVDPTVVIQKLVVDTGGLQDSYLGPPESFRGQ